MSLEERVFKALKPLLGNIVPAGPGKHSKARTRTFVFEQLENRCLMAVSINAEGWTMVDPSADSRIVYVSNSEGSDTNDGISELTPKQTIGAAMALIRDSSPDHLLLRRGDTWTEESFGLWAKSGRSADEPILIGAYGGLSGRPKVLTGSSAGIGFNINDAISNVAIIGLHFEPHTRTASDFPTGILVRGSGSNFILEDNYVSGFATNVNVQAPKEGVLTNTQVRRNIIVNAWGIKGGSHSQGMYATKVDNLLVEENLFDHNGWNETIVGAEATIFNHNMYITAGGGLMENIVIRGNISSRASSMGLKFQPHYGTHTIENNLFVRNGYSLQIGGGKPQNQTNPAHHNGFTVHANDNVISEGDNHGASDGLGVTFAHINGGSFSNNIIANKRTPTGTQSAMKFIDGIGWESEGYGIQDFSIDHNVVYNWRGRGLDALEPTQGDPVPVIQNVTFASNTLQAVDPNSVGQLIYSYTGDSSAIAYSDNTYYQQYAQENEWFRIATTKMSRFDWVAATGETGARQEQVSFFDPTRTTASFAATLGITTYEAFMGQVQQQSQSNWDARYTADAINDYIREGFELDPVGLKDLPSPSLDPPPGGSSIPGETAETSFDSSSTSVDEMQYQTLYYLSPTIANDLTKQSSLNSAPRSGDLRFKDGNTAVNLLAADVFANSLELFATSNARQTLSHDFADSASTEESEDQSLATTAQDWESSLDDAFQELDVF